MNGERGTAVVNGRLNNSLSPNHSPTKVLTSRGNPRPPPPPVRPRPQKFRPIGVSRVPLQKPQISIEEADKPYSPLSPPKSPPYDRLASPTSTNEEPSISDTRSAPTSPYNKASRREPEPSRVMKSSPQHLMVKSTNLKSNSLPLGVAMTRMEGGNISSRSPSDSESSDDEAESSPQRAHNMQVHNGMHLHVPVRKKRSETLDSLYSESNSESSSEDDKMPPILQTITDDSFDDVFQDVEIDMGSEVDSKLIDWAFNVFVPACCTLLSRCAEIKTQKNKESSSGVSAGAIESLSDCIQSDLRSLSNTINYFCSEQQRLSGLLKAKISSSISTDRMSKIAIDRASTLQARQTSSNTSSFSDASSGVSGYESHDSTADRSYAVKILRSVSQSLIAPLLHEAEDGFTDELYKSIIQALQKISWKVEACLSFNDSCKDNEIHRKIFDSERAPAIRVMMIGALPPEEPKLYLAATHASRSNSVSSPKHKKDSSSILSPTDHPGSSRIIRRTPSGRQRPEGTVFDLRTLPDSLKAVSGESSELTHEAKGVIDGDKTPLAPGSNETTPTTPHRGRTATTSEIEMSPSRRNRFATQASTEKATHYSDDFDDDFCPHYFRPKAARRTTISLSRKEVTKLGLTVAKRVEESIIPEVSSRFESNESSLHNPPMVITEDDIRKRLHDTLTKEFNQVGEDTKSRSYFERVRSASMSDLLEDNFDSNTPPRRHDSFQGLEGNRLDSRTGSVGTLDSNDDIISVSSARIEQSYVPSYHQQTTSSAEMSCESEWVYIKRQDTVGGIMDPRLLRQSSVQSEPATPLKRDKKLKHKSKSMDKVKRTLTSSLNTSGKFTDKLRKTAQALRRGSIASKPKKVQRMRVKSMDLLSETGGEGPLEEVPTPLQTHHKSSRSEPPSPIPAKLQNSDTISHSPSKKHKSLKRFMPKKSTSFNSSKGSRSLGRKTKGRSDFLQDYEGEMERECRMSFTESIENYSKIAVKPRATEGAEQLLVTVEIPGRHSMTKKERKRSSIISTGGDNWFEIVVTTNMKQFCRNHYTVLRTLKRVLSLHDSLSTYHGAGPVHPQLPERPDKKATVKKQRQQIEDFIRLIAYNQQLRSSQMFIDFLMPDDQEFGTSLTDGGSEVNFELLMTFYTPDVYNGPGDPGSSHQIQVVSGDESSKTVSPSPPSSRKHSLTQKRGTMHLVKGKEENSTFVIREEGHDALIVSSEDDRYVVVAGTFEKLVEQLACEEKPDPRFVMTFLLGYRHFSTASELLTILLRRFHMAVPPDATDEELAYAEKWRYVIQLRVLDILTYWMKKCWPDFYRSDVLLARVRDFTERLKSSKDTNFQMAGTNLDKVIEDKLASSGQYAYPPSESQSPLSSTPTTPVQPRPLTPSLSPGPLRTDATPSSPTKRRTSKGQSSSSIDLSTFTAIQVARQLTLIELDMLKAIETHELVVYMWESNTPENKPYRKNVDAFIERFNEVSYWVASEICSISDPRARGALIEKFVEVAKHCQEYKNFSTTISIVSGLSLGAIKRLKRSWEHVGEKPLKSFHKLQQIMKPANSHAAYRKALSGVKNPCIPYFGVYIRDLTLFNIGNEKTLKNGLLNFSKIRTMVLKFEELKRYQRSKYFFPVEDKIRDFCQNLWCMSESNLYEASETLEPRDPPPPAPPEETDV